MAAPAIDIHRAAKFSVPILHMDNHLLVVEKPYNMLTQRDDSGDVSLDDAMKQFLAQRFDKKGAVYLGLVHRLDRPAGGVLLLARTSKAAERLSKAFASGRVQRRYLAVVRGKVTAPMQLRHFLIKGANNTVRQAHADEPGAKEARLFTEPLCARADTTLVAVTLLTGRSHQIRVQHQLAGHPLWGDNRYGDGRPGQQLALWAHSLTVIHPTLKTEMTFVSAPPPIGAWREYQAELEAMP